MGTSTTTSDAANAVKYYPIWQRKFADQETDKQFTEWLPGYLQEQKDAENETETEDVTKKRGKSVTLLSK